MTPSPSTRKRPHCHTCGSPMAGHRRQDGRTVCPRTTFKAQSSSPSVPAPSLHKSIPASAPLTPPRSPTPTLINKSPRSVAPFEMPENGPWHRRNPNWRTATPLVQPPPVRMPSPVGSLVPTVLVDNDGHTIRESNNDTDADWDDDDDDNATVASSSSFYTPFEVMDELAGKPLVSVYSTKRKDIARLSNAAAMLGAHTGVVHATPNKSKITRRSPVSRDNSWWLVMGKDPELVQQIVDSPQRDMPGLVSDLQMEGPRMMSFLHLILAGFVGGCVAVYGLSWL